MGSRIRANATVDLLALITCVPMVVSGVVLYGILPSGGGGYKGGLGTVVSRDFLGLGRPEWVAIHDWSGFIFTALIIIHLVLHWRFMKHMPSYLRGTRKGDDT